MKYIKLFACLFCFTLLLTSCNKPNDEKNNGQNDSADLGGDNVSYGQSLDSLNAYDGLFDNEESDVQIKCVSGQEGAYKIENSTITFTALGQDSVYSISGQFKGNIIVDVGDEYKLDIELQGFSLVSDTINPITILSGNKVSITAKNEYENYIYDLRDEVTDESLYSGAIYSLCDLEICGKGKLTLVSESNNGIHTKDDLEIKNLTLLVSCVDNALKGNDSVTIESGNLTLIATQGDGIKTTNSGVSEKGNQRGTISILGGTHSIYSATDAIDASYNVVIDNESTVLNIYTDKYSNYSKEVTSVSENVYYIRFPSKSYSFSVKYYNSDNDYKWVNAEYHSSISGGMSSYYYYSFEKLSEYSKLMVCIYTDEMEQGQEGVVAGSTEYLSINDAYDTIAFVSRGYNMTYSWSNYTTKVNDGFGGMGRPGMGGMNDGNTDKGDYSTKGIKSANEILILNGTINIKSYDDALHANANTTLENGNTSTGNIVIENGTITIYSNDDGIHADGKLTIQGGSVLVSYSYEGLEGTQVILNGGSVSVSSKDDGINSTVTSGTGIEINSGTLYVYCSGDGLDSNSRSSYMGICFNGGDVAIISTSNGNSAIDTENGYSYTGGRVIAIMPSGGMSGEATDAQGFDSIGATKNVSLSEGKYLTVKAGGTRAVTIKMPCGLNGRVIYLGNNSMSVLTDSQSDFVFDLNGICWH